jgi:hypothetical protein
VLELRRELENKKAAKAAQEIKKKELAKQRAEQKANDERSFLELTKWLKANDLHTVPLKAWASNLTQIQALFSAPAK